MCIYVTTLHAFSFTNSIRDFCVTTIAHILPMRVAFNFFDYLPVGQFQYLRVADSVAVLYCRVTASCDGR